MKVLIPIHQHVRDNFATYEQSNRDLRALCKKLGYEVDVQVIEDASTYITGLDTSEYAFVALPRHRHETGMNQNDSFFDVFNLDIPVLISGLANDNALTVDQFTGSTLESAAAYKKINWLSPTMDIYMYAMDYEVVVGHEPFVTVLANDETTGRMVAWKRIESGKAPVYCFGGDPSIGFHQAFPVLLRQAILDGNIAGDKLPPKKLKSMWDIDDIPNTLNTEADIQSVIDIQNQHNWPISWGLKLGNATQPSGNDIWDTTVTPAMKQLLIDNAPVNGGYVYCMTHNHNWHWNMADAPINTKVAMDTEYRIDAARALADGVPLGYDADGLDSYGYIYPPNNRVSDEMFQLGSPQTNKLSDAANITPKKGYGWVSVRLYSDSYADGYGYSATVEGQRYHRGMLLLNGSFAILDSEINLTVDSALELNRLSNVFAKWFTQCMGYDAIHFFHGNNFLDGHDAGNAPALKAMQLIGQWADWMGDQHEFMHPKKFVESFGVSTGDPTEL